MFTVAILIVPWKKINRTAIPEDISQCPSNSSPQNTAPIANSDSDWSRVSSANSLEWDNVQNSIHASPPLSEVDTDTQFLLSEIERLTNKTLEETGQDLFSWLEVVKGVMQVV